MFKTRTDDHIAHLLLNVWTIPYSAVSGTQRLMIGLNFTNSKTIINHSALAFVRAKSLRGQRSSLKLQSNYIEYFSNFHIRVLFDFIREKLERCSRLPSGLAAYKC